MLFNSFEWLCKWLKKQFDVKQNYSAYSFCLDVSVNQPGVHPSRRRQSHNALWQVWRKKRNINKNIINIIHWRLQCWQSLTFLRTHQITNCACYAFRILFVSICIICLSTFSSVIWVLACTAFVWKLNGVNLHLSWCVFRWRLTLYQYAQHHWSICSMDKHEICVVSMTTIQQQKACSCTWTLYLVNVDVSTRWKWRVLLRCDIVMHTWL